MSAPTCSLSVPAPRSLACGERLLDAGERGPVWRLLSGVVRLDAGGTAFVGLGLPGDLLGLGARPEDGALCSVQALVPCRLVPEPMPDRALAWEQQHRRLLDAVLLRTGPASERLRRLLLMLGDATRADAIDLPTLRDMAVIIDSAPETVSRVISGLRRSDLLQQRWRQAVQFDTTRLGAAAMQPGLTRSSRRADPGAAAPT